MISNRSTPWLLLRSLLPSSASFACCILAGVIVVGLHVLLTSINKGAVLPHAFDGQWAATYAKFIVDPLQSFFSNNILNTFLLMVVWSVVGVVLYGVLGWGVQLFRDWREAEHDVSSATDGLVVSHPLRRSFVTRALWRFGVGVVGIGGIVLAQSWMRTLLATDADLLDSMAFGPALRDLGLSILAWAFLAHCVVVWLRLYTLRTRLFGDPKLY